MQRVIRNTAVVALPAMPSGGTPGYFANPNPGGGVPATVPGYEWFNSVQEELCAVIAAGGIALDLANTGQVIAAIKALYGNGRIGHVFTANDWCPLPGGLILQWGKVGGGTIPGGTGISASGLSWPVTFPNQVLAAWATVDGSGFAANTGSAYVFSVTNSSLGVTTNNFSGTSITSNGTFFFGIGR